MTEVAFFSKTLLAERSRFYKAFYRGGGYVSLALEQLAPCLRLLSHTNNALPYCSCSLLLASFFPSLCVSEVGSELTGNGRQQPEIAGITLKIRYLGSGSIYIMPRPKIDDLCSLDVLFQVKFLSIWL